MCDLVLPEITKFSKPGDLVKISDTQIGRIKTSYYEWDAIVFTVVIDIYNNEREVRIRMED